MLIKRKFKKYFIPHEENNHKPHFFREGAITVTLVVVMVLLISSMGSSYVVKKTDMLASIYASVLVDLTNEDRSESNESILAVNPLLVQAATEKAEDMASKEYFAHTSPEGITPWYWFKKVGYSFTYAGENLAIDFTESEAVQNAWLNSPTHRANILNKNFTEIGIAVKNGKYQGHSTMYVVQMFGTPRVSTLTAEASTVEEKTGTNEPTRPQAIASVISANIDTNNSVEKPVTVRAISETDSMVIVEHINSEEVAGVEAREEVVPVKIDAKEYMNWYERILVNQPYLVDLIYKILIVVIVLSLALYIFLEVKIHHPRHVLLGVVLLLIVIGFSLLNTQFLLPSFILV